MGYRILVAEDDEDIVELLRLYLENEGYQIVSVSDGVEAMKLLHSMGFDMAVLDVMMPHMNGYELTKEIRSVSNMPILILSAKKQDSDKILGLDLGADDYMEKPFNPLEVVARIQSNLRRFYELNQRHGNGKEEEPSRLKVGELQLNKNSFQLDKSGKEILLTPTEYKILSLLMKSPGKIYTKIQIYEMVNGEYMENDDNTIMVHMSKLREKIEDDPRNPLYIKTVRGVGYKIEKK